MLLSLHVVNSNSLIQILCCLQPSRPNLSDEANDENKPQSSSLFTFFYSNSPIKRLEGTYIDGKKNGLFKEFYSTGLVKSVGQYQQNLKHDKKFQEFTENGD